MEIKIGMRQTNREIVLESEQTRDDVTAAEQGNRDQDRMEAETGEQELPEY